MGQSLADSCPVNSSNTSLIHILTCESSAWDRPLRPGWLMWKPWLMPPWVRGPWLRGCVPSWLAWLFCVCPCWDWLLYRGGLGAFRPLVLGGPRWAAQVKFNYLSTELVLFLLPEPRAKGIVFDRICPPGYQLAQFKEDWKVLRQGVLIMTGLNLGFKQKSIAQLILSKNPILSQTCITSIFDNEHCFSRK